MSWQKLYTYVHANVLTTNEQHCNILHQPPNSYDIAKDMNTSA